MDGLDARELDKFARDLLELATQQFPRETNKFLRTEATKLRRKTLSKAKQKVTKDTGSYYKSIKRGKLYRYQGDMLSIRVYSGDPKAHLLEYGHRIVDKTGQEHGFQAGKHVFDETSRQYQNEFVSNCEKFIDDMLDKGLR